MNLNKTINYENKSREIIGQYHHLKGLSIIRQNEKILSNVRGLNNNSKSVEISKLNAIIMKNQKKNFSLKNEQNYASSGVYHSRKQSMGNNSNINGINGDKIINNDKSNNGGNYTNRDNGANIDNNGDMNNINNTQRSIVIEDKNLNTLKKLKNIFQAYDTQHQSIILAGKAKIKHSKLYQNLDNNSNIKPMPNATINHLRNISFDASYSKNIASMIMNEMMYPENLEELKHLYNVNDPDYIQIDNNINGTYIINNSLLLKKLQALTPTRKKIELPNINVLPDVDIRKTDPSLHQTPNKIFKLPASFEKNILAHMGSPRTKGTPRNGELIKQNNASVKQANHDSTLENQPHIDENSKKAQGYENIDAPITRRESIRLSLEKNNEPIQGYNKVLKIREKVNKNPWERRPKLQKMDLKEILTNSLPIIDCQSKSLTLETSRYSPTNDNEDNSFKQSVNDNDSLIFITNDYQHNNSNLNKSMIESTGLDSPKYSASYKLKSHRHNTLIYMNKSPGLNYHSSPMKPKLFDSINDSKSKVKENSSIVHGCQLTFMESNCIGADKMDEVLRKYFMKNLNDTIIKKNQKDVVSPIRVHLKNQGIFEKLRQSLDLI